MVEIMKRQSKIKEVTETTLDGCQAIIFEEKIDGTGRQTHAILISNQFLTQISVTIRGNFTNSEELTKVIIQSFKVNSTPSPQIGFLSSRIKSTQMIELEEDLCLSTPIHAEERVRFLARGSELLNQMLVYQHAIGALADIAVPIFASHVTVDLLEDGSLRCVGARHVDPEKTRAHAAAAGAVSAHRRSPSGPARTADREPQFVADVQAEARTMAHDDEHARAIQELGNTSGIVVPLIARGRTFGAITFGTVPPHPQFTDSDFDLAIELGRRASVALDNALLYGQVEARAHAVEALEFVDDGVFLVDGDGVVRLWNPAAAKTFRVKAGKALGRRVADVIKDWETVLERVRAASEPTAGARPPETLPVDVHGEERWLSMSAVEFGGGTVYAFRDMTDERAVEQLKSDFVSTVSHELRTPLAAIYGAALTLQRDDVRLEESQRTGLLDVISSEADRLARIVNDILWASRLDSGQMGVAIVSCNALELANKVIGASGPTPPSGSSSPSTAGRAAGGRSGSGQAPTGLDEPARQRGEVLARRWPGSDPAATGRGPDPVPRRGRGPRHPVAEQTGSSRSSSGSTRT